MKLIAKSAKETQDFAKKFAKNLKGSRVIALYGDLGAGKTTFVQALAKELGIKNKLISPTFVIMREYERQKFKLFHIDLYRINSEDEIFDLGILELFSSPRNIIAIEWAEKIEKLLPKNTKRIYLKYLGENKRSIEVK